MSTALAPTSSTGAPGNSGTSNLPSDLLSLETSLLKVQHDSLRKQLRNHHKLFVQLPLSSSAKDKDNNKASTGGGNNPDLSSLKDVDALLTKYKDSRNKLQKLNGNLNNELRKTRNRVDWLKQGEALTGVGVGSGGGGGGRNSKKEDGTGTGGGGGKGGARREGLGIDYEQWSSTRLNLLLIDYFLRMGFKQTARQMAEEGDVDPTDRIENQGGGWNDSEKKTKGKDEGGNGVMVDLSDLSLFSQLESIEISLRNRRTNEAIAWCRENGSSTAGGKEGNKEGKGGGEGKDSGSGKGGDIAHLESLLRLQDFVELCRSKQHKEAISYFNKWLKPHLALHPAQTVTTNGSSSLIANGSGPGPSANGNETSLSRLGSGSKGLGLASTTTGGINIIAPMRMDEEWEVPIRDRVIVAMGLLAFGQSTGVGRYQYLYSPYRWRSLLSHFRKTFLSHHSFPPIPALHISISAGLAALKTTSCVSFRVPRRKFIEGGGVSGERDGDGGGREGQRGLEEARRRLEEEGWGGMMPIPNNTSRGNNRSREEFRFDLIPNIGGGGEGEVESGDVIMGGGSGLGLGNLTTSTVDAEYLPLPSSSGGEVDTTMDFHLDLGLSEGSNARDSKRSRPTPSGSSSNTHHHPFGSSSFSAHHHLHSHLPHLSCPLCTSPLAILGLEVPAANHSNSTIVCGISGRVIGGGSSSGSGGGEKGVGNGNGDGEGGVGKDGAERDEMMVLPNGRVYSREALELMATKGDGRVRCPRTGDIFLFSELKKVYIT